MTCPHKNDSTWMCEHEHDDDPWYVQFNWAALWPLGTWTDVPGTDLQVMARGEDPLGKIWIRRKTDDHS